MSNRDKNSWLLQFIQDNLIKVIVLVVTFTAAWTLFGSRLDTVELKASQIEEKVEQLQKIIERIIVLEEHDNTITRDIGEIKADIRDIKKLYSR